MVKKSGRVLLGRATNPYGGSDHAVIGRRLRRIPSKKWRELIKKVWEADPLRCPKCSRECASFRSLVFPRRSRRVGHRGMVVSLDEDFGFESRS